MASISQKSQIMTEAARELVESYPMGSTGRYSALRFQREVAALSENEAARLLDLITASTKAAA
jgi:hypothetical protein